MYCEQLLRCLLFVGYVNSSSFLICTSVFYTRHENRGVLVSIGFAISSDVDLWGIQEESIQIVADSLQGPRETISAWHITFCTTHESVLLQTLHMSMKVCLQEMLENLSRVEDDSNTTNAKPMMLIHQTNLKMLMTNTHTGYIRKIQDFLKHT
jgi:hypothetical protein